MKILKDDTIAICLDAVSLNLVQRGLTTKVIVPGSQSHMGEVIQGNIVKLFDRLHNYIYVKVVSKEYLKNSFCTQFEIELV